MALPKLGTPCVINIRNSDSGSYKWGTTHPNREEGKLGQYLMDLSSRWILGPIASTMNIERREPPE